MEAAYRAGEGDFVHLQGPAPQQLVAEGLGEVAACVGDAMPPVAFSSLTASRAFLETGPARAFLQAYAQAREWADQAPAAEVARAEASFFPGIREAALTESIARYQKLGCWDGGLEIPKPLYEQALTVFEYNGKITRRWPYEDVVVPPPL
jgi:NitT/TauT family transport system substrate-binding protein